MITRRGGTIARSLAVSAALLALAACGGEPEAEAAAPTAVSVGTENIVVVEPDRIQAGPLISGSLEAEEQAAIRAEVGGAVLEVYAEEGEAVRRGERLARIEDTEVRDAYLSAQTAIRSAENALEVAQRDAERSQTLADAGAIAGRDLELARTQLSNAQAQSAQAQAQFAAARERLDATRVASPITGIVSQRATNAGDIVTPGAALFTVIDPGSMELRASVPSQALSELRVGTPVEFEVRGYPGRTFTGEIERIAPAVDPATGQVPIFVSIPNTGGTLVSGLFAEGRVATEERTGLIVPLSAVDTESPTPTVMRVRGGQAEEVPVELGLADPRTERVEIVSGITPGDTLLAGAARLITPGTPVRIGSAAPAAASR